jgi:pseudouridine kinase
MGGRNAIVVIGGANADVKSRTDAPLVAGTSNPGRTTVAAGGVGRNIAASLARLGVPVALVSVVGTDPLGDLVVAATAQAGVDVGGIARLPAAGTGIYNAILDHDGGLVAGVASMDALRYLTGDLVHEQRSRIATAAWVVLDANLSSAALGAALDIATRAGTPVALEPVSVPKARAASALLATERPIALLTPNQDELAALTGIVPLDDGSLHEACHALHRAGVRIVWVRLGARGSVLSIAGAARPVHVPTLPCPHVADVTGAGDAALAGYLWASCSGHDVRTAARYGTAAALLTLRSRAAVAAALEPSALHALVPTIPEPS